MGNLVFQATLGGQVNLVGPNTASTYNINVPAVAGTLVTTGDTATVTNTMLSGPVSIANGGTNNNAFTAKSGNVAGLVFFDGTKLANDATVTDIGYDTSANKLTTGNDASISGLTVGKGASSIVNNTAVGINALSAVTTADGSTGIGWEAARKLTTGSASTAVGYAALHEATTGGGNSAFGWLALYGTTTGTNNVGIGVSALQSNTTASSNTAVGYQAGYSTTIAGNNTYFGALAGYSNVTGSYNVYTGGYAGQYQTGGSNVAMGLEAFKGVNGSSTGAYNTAIGMQALNGNTTASANTAVGYQAGYSFNGATGLNTFLGNQSGYTANSSSYSNTFVGQGAGYYVSSGHSNTIIGRYDGNSGVLDIRTLSNFVVLADGDGNPMYFANYSGSHSFALNGVTYYQMDTTRFYAQLIGGVDGTQALGNSNRRWSVVYAVNGTIQTSDANQKQDIAELDDAEKRVAAAIKGLIKKFRLKDAVAKKGDDARIHVGVIAQDVQAAFIAEGLDPNKYGLFCSDTWYEVDGKDTDDAGAFYTADAENAVPVTRLGIRYEELLAFVISSM